MKQIFKFLAILTSAALLLGQPARVCAQAKSTSPAAGAAPEATADSASSSESWKKRMKEFTSDNLPLGEVIKILQEQFPGINFVATPEARDAAVPLLQLRSVTPQEILSAIQIATRGEIQYRLEGENLVAFTFGAGPAGLAKPKKICRAFSLVNLLSNHSPEEVPAAIKDVNEALSRCWLMLADANPDSKAEQPQISLHRETKLLIVVGEPEQLNVVEQVVAEVERGAMNRMIQPPPPNMPGALPMPPQPLRQPPTRTLRQKPSEPAAPEAPASPSPIPAPPSK